jgi:hypothetical protein
VREGLIGFELIFGSGFFVGNVGFWFGFGVDEIVDGFFDLFGRFGFLGGSVFDYCSDGDLLVGGGLEMFLLRLRLFENVLWGLYFLLCGLMIGYSFGVLFGQ